jgi:5-methylcytosine-specific restriction endonuclease McrA
VRSSSCARPSPDAAGFSLAHGDTMGRLSMLKPRIETVRTDIAAPMPKVGDGFYSTAEWIALRDRVRREAKGMCQVRGCTRRGHTVDHIVEIRDGGPTLDRANLMLMCQPHHVEKTNTERANRMAKRY